MKLLLKILAPVAAILIAVTLGVSVMAADVQEIEILPIYNERVNPAYGQQIELEYTSDAENLYADETQYYVTLEDAAAALRAGLEAREPQVAIGIKTMQHPNEVSFHEIIFDEAVIHTGVPTQGDYILRHYSGYNCRTSGSYNSFTGIFSLVLTYSLVYHSTSAQEQMVDQQVKNVLDQLNVYDQDDYHKVCAIYDYICKTVYYDHDGLNAGDDIVYSAYAALINKKSVCQGYANLFYRLALELGVDCRIIAGTGNGGPHAWNIVKLDGQYYNLDATWDAVRKQSGQKYDYFLRCDSRFYDHYRNLEFMTVSFYDQYPMGAADYTYVPSAPSYVKGEFDGQDGVTDSDAVYLLRHALFPDVFPVAAGIDKDINCDGIFSDADAVYLLRFTLFPSTFPLYPGK